MPFDENGIWVDEPTPPAFLNNLPPQTLATIHAQRINWENWTPQPPQQPQPPPDPVPDPYMDQLTERLTERLTEFEERRVENNRREGERLRRLREAGLRRIKAKEKEMRVNPYNNPGLYGLRIIYKHEEPIKAPNGYGSRHRFLALVVFKNEIKNEFLGAVGSSDKAREYMFAGYRLHNLDKIIWQDWENGNLAAWNGMKTFKTEQINELRKALKKEGFKDWSFQQNPDFERPDDDDDGDFAEEDDNDGNETGT